MEFAGIAIWSCSTCAVVYKPPSGLSVYIFCGRLMAMFGQSAQLITVTLQIEVVRWSLWHWKVSTGDFEDLANYWEWEFRVWSNSAKCHAHFWSSSAAAIGCAENCWLRDGVPFTKWLFNVSIGKCIRSSRAMETAHFLCHVALS